MPLCPDLIDISRRQTVSASYATTNRRDIPAHVRDRDENYTPKSTGSPRGQSEATPLKRKHMTMLLTTDSRQTEKPTSPNTSKLVRRHQHPSDILFVEQSISTIQYREHAPEKMTPLQSDNTDNIRRKVQDWQALQQESPNGDQTIHTCNGRHAQSQSQPREQHAPTDTSGRNPTRTRPDPGIATQPQAPREERHRPTTPPRDAHLIMLHPELLLVHSVDAPGNIKHITQGDATQAAAIGQKMY